MSVTRLSESYDIVIPIGDLHIHKDDVQEGERFIRWIVDGAKIVQNATGKKVLLAFMGDQHNDFAVMRVEVSAFWSWAYAYINMMLDDQSLSITGNHDMNQDESASAMTSQSARTRVVARDAVFINDTVAAVGFMRKEDLFYEKVMTAYAAGARTILCHAEFQGSQYENGFYAPHGFDLSKYPADLKFISGHIHMKQEFGNVFYVGTPRHLTRSDIGEVKGVHVLDFQKGTREFIETPSSVCAPFQEIILDESGPYQDPSTIPDSPKIYVEIRGSKEFAKKISRALSENIKVRSTYTDEIKNFVVKESEGIPATFNKFSEEFFKTNNVSEKVREAVLAKVYDTCPSLKIGVR